MIRSVVNHRIGSFCSFAVAMTFPAASELRSSGRVCCCDDTRQIAVSPRHAFVVCLIDRRADAAFLGKTSRYLRSEVEVPPTAKARPTSKSIVPAKSAGDSFGGPKLARRLLLFSSRTRLPPQIRNATRTIRGLGDANRSIHLNKRTRRRTCRTHRVEYQGWAQWIHIRKH